MYKVIGRIFGCLLFGAVLMAVMWPFTLVAQEMSITASVDRNAISLGDQLTLSVRVIGTAQNVPDPQLPPLADFTIYSSGSSTSISIMNGKYSVTKDFNYVLVPKKVGKFTIQPVAVSMQGKTWQTNPLNVEVVQGNAPAQAAPPAAGRRQAQPQGGGRYKIYVKALLDREQAYVNQQTILTFELYTNINLAGISFKDYPQLTGFWTEELSVPRNQSQSIVNINGERFLKVILKKVALFPLSAGKLTIAPATLICDVDDFTADPFASFFGRTMSSSRPQQITSSAAALNVLPIPTQGRPASYRGAIGRYNFRATVDKTTVKAGDPVTLVIKISGTGNIKTVEQPELPSLPDFEKYDSGSSANITNQNYLVQGDKTLKYLCIPKSAGRHVINAMEFAYFDPAAKAFKTIRTEPLVITATPGEKKSTGTFMMGNLSKENVKALESDIQFIKTAVSQLPDEGDTIYKRAWFYLLQLLPLAALTGALVYRRYAVQYSENAAGARSRRAHRMARKRLDHARQLAGHKQSAAFFAAISKALVDYIGDKLNIAATGATTQRITEILTEKSVKAELIARFTTCLEFCDFARFAPSSVKPGDQEKALRDAEEAMVELEKEQIA